MEIKRGQVYMVDFDMGGKKIGSEYKGKRPCVIVANNLNNRYSPTLQVMPITSQTKNNLPTHHTVTKEDYGFLPKDASTLMAESTTCVSKKRLIEYLGTLEQKDIRKMNECLRVQFSL